MNKPLTEHELLLNERYYYQEKKWEVMNLLPSGDERAIRLDTYNKILDVLNAALWGNQKASTERINAYLNDMEERLSQVMEWQEML